MLEKFIIDKINDPYLLKAILPVIEVNGEYLTLEYKTIDGSIKTIIVHINDGEYYNEETILRRKKDLMISNILGLMNEYSISINDLTKIKI